MRDILLAYLTDISQAAKDEDLNLIINDTTPWGYLISTIFANENGKPNFLRLISSLTFPLVPIENQILVLSKGLEHGVIGQTFFLDLARHPPVPFDACDLSTIVQHQLRLTQVLDALSGVVRFSRTSVFAAMHFDATLPLLKSQKVDMEKAFMTIDMITSAIVKKDSSSWPSTLR